VNTSRLYDEHCKAQYPAVSSSSLRDFKKLIHLSVRSATGRAEADRWTNRLSRGSHPRVPASGRRKSPSRRSPDANFGAVVASQNAVMDPSNGQPPTGRRSTPAHRHSCDGQHIQFPAPHLACDLQVKGGFDMVVDWIVIYAVLFVLAAAVVGRVPAE
jgi:hypothetical protein